jgi:dTDP-4-dehydrorhamnose reductase
VRLIKVAVLGSTGMVGHEVVNVLGTDERQRFIVLGLDRTGFDANNPCFGCLNEFDYIINCIGVVWQGNPSKRDMFYTNSVFPHLLYERCGHFTNRKVIHVSSDCVFSGKRGGYSESNVPDATSDYGISKALGEPRDGMVLRTSIIGRELKTKHSFVEWAINQRGQEVNGFVNHVWNGVTSRQYGRILAQVMTEDLWAPGVHHVFSTSLTKHDLLCKVSDGLGLDLRVKPVTQDLVDRSLVTEKALNGRLNIPSIDVMIDDLK